MKKPLLIKIIKKQVHDWKKEIKTKRAHHLLNMGQQDYMDLLSYEGLEEKQSYITIDDQCMRTLFISEYPYHAMTGWLSSLITFNRNVDISYHIQPIDATFALPQLTRKITELESIKRMQQRSGQIVGTELTDPLESAMELKTNILRGQEKLFQVSLYICLVANTLEELNKTTTLLETLLGSKLFHTKIARFQQLEALDSVLPRAEDRLGQKRNLDTSSAALTFPFTSSELVQETGILYGINRSNNSLVMVDRFTLPNANSITFAQSGSGKSYASKVEILRQLMQGTKVIVIDPEREYKQLCHSVGGSYIHLGLHSQEKINPFDCSASTNSLHSLAEHIQSLTELLTLMADGVSADERAALDKALIVIYKQHGWSLSGKKQGKTYPLLVDLYAALKNDKQKGLYSRLEKYVTGSLASVFNSQTTVKVNNRLVVFDIKDLPESLRKILLFVVTNFVYIQVKNDPQKRLLVIDEGWLLLEHEESARFIAGLTRRARKYYLGVNIITQQANDFLHNEYGRAIASQAALRILMRQDTTTINGVVAEFKLSEYEQKFLLTCERGEALLLADHNHIALKIVASEKEHPLITTQPSEGFRSL